MTIVHALCVVFIAYADPSPCGGAEEAYVVDADGNLVEAANDIAYEAFAYDDAGRLSEAVTEVGGVVFASAWSRDADGLVTNVVYTDGKSVARTYDLAGRLVAVRDWLGHEWTFAWDGATRPTGGISPDGTAHSFSYDAAGRLSAWSVTGVAGRMIERDSAGRRVRDTVTAGLMPAATLWRNAENTFDAADRLVSAKAAYNGSHNPVQETFLYDGNGAMTNATSGGETMFSATYDAQGRLASLEGSANFSYDALGNRVVIGGHIFLPDHSDPLKRPLIECDPDGTPLRYYIWGPGRLLGFIDAADTLTVAHSDEQGSVIALTDETGELLFRANYSPYGEDWGSSGTNATSFAWLGGLGVMRIGGPLSSADASPFGQLYLTRHRLYSPVLRRFLSADPLGIDGGLNLYAYANGDPLAYIDPLGLCAMGGDGWTRIAGFFQMIGGGVEATVGYGFAGLTAETGVGIAAGVAVGLHGTDVAIAGYYTMVNGVPQDTLTSQGLQAVGVPQDWANGVDAGISMAGTMGVGAATTAYAKNVNQVSMTPYVVTDQGIAVQSCSKEALAAARKVKGGATVYKGGVLGRSETTRSQFLSLENPLGDGYAMRYGVPPQNAKFNFVLTGEVPTGVNFITRPAVGVGNNVGGAIEVVIPANTFKINSFYMP